MTAVGESDPSSAAKCLDLCQVLGKPHRRKISVHLGIAQIAIRPPPQTGNAQMNRDFPSVGLP